MSEHPLSGRWLVTAESLASIYIRPGVYRVQVREHRQSSDGLWAYFYGPGNRRVWDCNLDFLAANLLPKPPPRSSQRRNRRKDR